MKLIFYTGVSPQSYQKRHFNNLYRYQTKGESFEKLMYMYSFQ